MTMVPVNDRSRFGQQAQAANPQGSDPMQNKNKTGLPGVAKPGMMQQPALKKPGSFTGWQNVARPIGGNLAQNVANFEARARNNQADNKLLEIPGGEGEPGGGVGGGMGAGGIAGKGGSGAAPGTAEANVKPYGNTPLPGSNIVPPTPTPSPGTFQGTTGTAGQAGAGKSGGGAAPPGGQLGGINKPGGPQTMDQPPPGGWPGETDRTVPTTVPTGTPAGGGGAK